ncbi:MAG: hypothetical protein AAF617_04490 [Bacteroidota bacterium]
MKETSEWLLKAMRLFAWIIFVWMLVKAGAMIMAYGASVENPEGAKDLYRGLDFSRYYEASFVHYSVIVLYYILLYLLLAYVALFATRLLSVATLENLHSSSFLGNIQKIGTTTVGVFGVALIHNVHVFILDEFAALKAVYFSGEYIFLAAMVYIISLIFIKSTSEKLQKD